MLDAETWERIARYALGECSAEEAIAARAWIEADPEREALAGELIRLADGGPTAIWDAQAAWLRFHATVADDVPTRPRRAASGPDEGGRRHLIGRDVLPSLEDARRRPYAATTRTRRGRRLAAAAVIVACGMGVAVWQATRPGGDGIARNELRAVATERGQTADLYLSDGTHVTLGVASTLRFPSRFRGTRDIVLEGEAYFDVAPDERWPWQPERPFTVRVEGATVRDLGTRFSVRAYAGDAGTEVVVAEGSVLLAPDRRATNELVLAAGDLGRLLPKRSGQPRSDGRLRHPHLRAGALWTVGVRR